MTDHQEPAVPDNDFSLDPATGTMTVGHLAPWTGIVTIPVPGGVAFQPATHPAIEIVWGNAHQLRIVGEDGEVLVTLPGAEAVQIHHPDRVAEAADRFRAALLSACGQPEPERPA